MPCRVRGAAFGICRALRGHSFYSRKRTATPRLSRHLMPWSGRHYRAMRAPDISGLRRWPRSIARTMDAPADIQL